MMSERSGKGRLRVLVADDHFVVREGLRLILEGQQDFEVVGYAADGLSALRMVEEQEPHVVLMDLRMPGMDGLEAIEQLRRRWPQVSVVILTTYDDEDLMLKGLQAGASGYLIKDVDRATLFHAIRTAARGETLLPSEVLVRLLERTASTSSGSKPHRKSARAGEAQLTEREQAVLEGVARGERNKEIAARLSISEPTVKTHLASIYHKLAVDSRASAVAVAIERGLLVLDSTRSRAKMWRGARAEIV